MFINITDSEKGDNKSSSGQLVHYLDKEQRLFDAPSGQWFNGTSRDILSYQVRTALDNNVAKLGKGDAKFFLINISPSQKELRHLLDRFGEQILGEELKQYTGKVMDEYARNFHRPGVSSHKDLLWFAKLEHYRYYSFRDKEVRLGEVKAGDVKPGDHRHIQVIVSRKDVTNKIKLSPMNKSRGRNAEHSKKLGQFDRSSFKQSGEIVFDKTFVFDRKLEDTYKYLNAQENGNSQERIALGLQRENLKKPDSKLQEGLMMDIPGLTAEIEKMDIVELLLQPGQDYSSLMPRAKKNKRKKGQRYRI